jgi:ATP-dependent DNA helicase RecG
MTIEGLTLDQKSLRYALDKHEEADGLACDCVGFANAMGGTILLGIEDGLDEPPASQKVADDFPARLRKRLSQVTVNVGVAIRKATAGNGGEFVAIQVFRNEQSIAARSDGRYFIRVSDETPRLVPDDLGRRMAEKNPFVWELQTTRRVSARGHDDAKLADFVKRVRASDRVSEFVRVKAESELLEHYLFVRSGLLTNMGILWIGRREDRAALLYPPEIQRIKYDERGRKVRKQVWNDYSLNPLELIEAVWREVPDWKEIPRRKVRRELAELVQTSEIGSQGVKRGTIYFWTK